MAELQQSEWQQMNDDHVSASVAWIRALLAERVPVPKPLPVKKKRQGLFAWLFGSNEETSPQTIEQPRYSELTSAEAKERMDELSRRFSERQSLPALEILANKFGLSSFEVQIIQLCLAFELDTRIGWLCGLIQDKPYRPYPTYGLAMTIFSDPAWQATHASGHLRKFGVIDVQEGSDIPFVAGDLRLREPMLHYLRGIPALDSYLEKYQTHVYGQSGWDIGSPPSRRLIALAKSIEATGNPFVVVQFLGRQKETFEQAAQLARMFQRTLYSMGIESLPSSLDELKLFGSRWNRDSRLFDLVMVVHADSGKDPANELRLRNFLSVLQDSTALVCVLTEDRLELQIDDEQVVEIGSPDASDQRTMWMSLLPKELVDRHQVAGELSRQFSVRPDLARQLVAAGVVEVGDDLEHYKSALRRHCNIAHRPRLQGLAQRIDCKAGWNDLILPREPQQMLGQLADQVRYRYRVYDEWGFANRMNRGLGVSAMFAGESGTGKTMAAEIIAGELGLDLYRVDLSSVVNKYIGETEKHLRRLFDAFESCGAVLFFDECDALFGKRSEVKDSHDRYANIEINYLLQRLETYRGVAILATNNRGAIDKAFLRRLRFIVNFPMPELADRERIWKRHLGVGEPTSSLGLLTGPIDIGRLAQFPLSGGNVQSIVMNAAFRAAARSSDAEVTMPDLLSATRDEYLKLDRPISESQFRWVEPTPTPQKREVLT